jgi:hypothetical protein
MKGTLISLLIIIVYLVIGKAFKCVMCQFAENPPEEAKVTRHEQMYFDMFNEINKQRPIYVDLVLVLLWPCAIIVLIKSAIRGDSV